MATVKEIYSYFDGLFPRSLSCEWDNDGLMVCADSSAPVSRVLLTLDVTEKVLAYAKNGGFDLIISHHPFIFHKLGSITDKSAALPLEALASNITVMSFHTRFDAAEGGMNDTLAKLLGLTATGSFGPEGEENCGRICEIPPVPFSSLVNKVKDVLSAPNICAAKANPNSTKVALLGGDGKDFIGAAVSAGADTFITGGASYNSMLDACAAGLSVIEAGHYQTEFLPFTSRISELLAGKFTDLQQEISPVGCEILYI